MTTMKGIILAGGKGTRLLPSTLSLSKHLMMVYDKPMIFYPLSTLMLANIRQVIIVTDPSDVDDYKALLKDGSHLGIQIEYAVQTKPKGIADSLLAAEPLCQGHSCAVILGDNIFHGNHLAQLLQSSQHQNEGATLFAYYVDNPQDYGVVTTHTDTKNNTKIVSLIEKPKKPLSNWAVTGLYFYDSMIFSYAKQVSISPRKELEITDVNKMYLQANTLKVNYIGRGYTWLDAGSVEKLYEASSFVRIAQRHGLKISFPEEIALNHGWITKKELSKSIKMFKKSLYGQYLCKLQKI